jgi:S1-C subfamily serine protease
MRGDIIIAVDGVPVEGRDHLVRLVQFSPVGSELDITYLRRGVKRTTTITLGDRHSLLGVTPP